MPDPLAGVVAAPDLWLLVAAAAVAGLVRGFAGFGTALVFMPMAGGVLAPLSAIVAMTAMDVAGLAPQVPRAVRSATRAEVARMLAGAALALPAGLWLAAALPVGAFRWLVSGLSLALVGLLAAGWRWRGTAGRGAGYGIGALSGFLGGACGLAGPPAILLNVASDRPAAVIRANLLAYLAGFGLMLLVLLGLAGGLRGADLLLGLLLALPFLAASLLGAWLFDPSRERLYRRAAYLIIAASAIAGLPFWGG